VKKSDAQAKEDQPAQIHVLSNLSTRKEKMPPKPPDKGLSSLGVKLQRNGPQSEECPISVLYPDRIKAINENL